ncbi:carboxypeptidase regulatory-like domain-containing protein [Bacillus sp. DNRA2]|uniref:carboxypeptidase-like regulatory domain-containing protein n=1 Tax=Bacillus sp. DNRA2 TaxID=2723053 RepID=UPI00145C86A2|nr:carboxypeptidase-like regulatory domain-containing protein [Bacillus sp. DNRA2]NMD71767.1 carboxypeptidase regulatory-like domain-containing protein [Bacillus sp. DNRA2]
MKNFALLILTVLTFGLLAACGTKQEVVSQSRNVKMTLDYHDIAVSEWKSDGSHHVEIKGTLTVEGEPVVGAKIQNSERRIMKTNENGEFSLTVDSNIVEKNVIKVIDVRDATVEAKKLNKQTKKSLLALEDEIVIHYPIEVDKVEANQENSELVDVYGKAQLHKGEKFPKFGTYKYRVTGTIKDHSGHPVEGATVNLRRDGVEGFSMSDPSDANGVFAMYYIPEDDENHYFSVYVPSKNKTYTLPENRAFLFPDDVGVNIKITLPETGNVIDDTLENLIATTEPGSLHRGVLIGVQTDEDYSITVPKRDGSFTLTISKAVWENNPKFYELNYQGFHEDEITSGDTLSSSQIPKPAKYDPVDIKATKK